MENADVGMSVVSEAEGPRCSPVYTETGQTAAESIDAYKTLAAANALAAREIALTAALRFHEIEGIRQEATSIVESARTFETFLRNGGLKEIEMENPGVDFDLNVQIRTTALEAAVAVHGSSKDGYREMRLAKRFEAYLRGEYDPTAED